MSQITLDPYINFHGKAREAMEFYHKIFGGKLDLLAFDPSGAPKPAEAGEGIMHSRLEVDGGGVIFGTDGSPDYPPTVGDHMAIALGGSDHVKLSKIFDGLAEGGKVKMPLKPESWGDTFGYLEDKFGINWMVNISKAA